MEFAELNIEEYEEFLNNHKLKSFLQTVEFGQMKEKEGFTYHLVGLKNNNEILCATMLLSYKGKLPGKVFSCPRGFLIDYNDFDLLKTFTLYIKKYIKSKGGYILNIEPKILYQEHDINGDIVENGFNNKNAYNNLIIIGYKHNGFYEELNPNKQVRWAFVLDLENKTEEQVFKNFDAKTRNQLKRIEKYGITTREIGLEELEKFKNIVENSGQRKQFHSRSLSYYENMYNIFKPKNYIKYILAELNLSKYINFLNEEITKTNNKINSLKEHAVAQKKELKSYVKSLEEKLQFAETTKEKKGNIVTLAGGMFMTYGDELVYLFSGSDGDYLFFGGQYLVQWDMIKYAIRNNFKKYNFYGINGNFSKEDKRHGLYEFKKGFDGTVIEYIGDFDLIISKPTYIFKKIASKIIK